MTAISSDIQEGKHSPSASATAAEVDQAAAWPVLLMIGASLLWLVLGSALGLLASVKMHGPHLLANVPAFTYGRLAFAQNTLFLYGFALQAGLALAVWLISRLSRATLPNGVIVSAGAIIWNLGVLGALLLVLGGETTGLWRLEFPASAAMTLLLGFVIIATVALLNLKARTVQTLYPSLWFAQAGVFWFPWVFAGGTYLLLFGLLRGSAIPVIAAWYGQNLVGVVLSCFALGAGYYFVPKLTERPLYSEGLAIFGFWTVILFAPLGGFTNVSAVPRWLISLSTVSQWMVSVGMLAHAYNFYQTWKSGASKSTVFGLGFFKASALLLALWSIMGAWATLPANASVLMFTHFHTGLSQLLEYGFIGLTFLGSLTVAASLLMKEEWPSASLSKGHLILSIVGISLMTLPLCAVGMTHGAALADATVPFVETLKRTFPMFAMTTLGLLVFCIAQVLFLLHFVQLAVKSFVACCRPIEWITPEKGGSK